MCFAGRKLVARAVLFCVVSVLCFSSLDFDRGCRADDGSDGKKAVLLIQGMT